MGLCGPPAQIFFSLLPRRSSTFLLWALYFMSLTIWSAPPLQPPPSCLSPPEPPSDHVEQLAILSADPGLWHFLFCWERLWSSLHHSLGVSSTVTTSNGQPSSPVVLQQCLPLSSTTPYIHLSYVILLLSFCLPVFPTGKKTCQ